MSQEIVYTSAPQGLKAGSRGFCTVVSTSGMGKNLAERLEGLSAYRHVYMPQDEQSHLNPVNYSHVRITVGGQTYDILSRIADAGLDYTGRTNKLAHHVACDAAETRHAPGGPAWALAQPDFCLTNWDGQVRLAPAGRLPTSTDCPTGICHTWQRVTGDAGWAGVLAANAQDRQPPLSLIFPPGMETLPLIVEALSLLPPDKRWGVTFNTYFTKLPAGVDCQWRFLLDGTPEATALRRNPHAKCLDLCSPRGAAPDGELVTRARTGVHPQQRPVEPAPEVESRLWERRLVADEPALIPVEATAAAAPAKATATLAPAATYLPAQRKSVRHRPRFQIDKTVAALVIVCLGIVVFLGVETYLNSRRTAVELPVPPPRAPAKLATERPTAKTDSKPPRREYDPRATLAKMPATKLEPVDSTPVVEDPIATAPAAALEPVPDSVKLAPQRGDPLADIRRRKNRLHLPDRDTSLGVNTAYVELAKIDVVNPADCELTLSGEQVAKRQGREIKVEQVDESGARTWKVVAIQENSITPNAVVAVFQLRGDSLKFRWERNATVPLQYAFLNVRVGDQTERCTLKKPREIEPIALTVSSAEYPISLPLDSSAAEFSEQARMDLDFVGLPHTIADNVGLTSGKSAVIKLPFANSVPDGPHELEIRTTFALDDKKGSRGLSVRLSTWARTTDDFGTLQKEEKLVDEKWLVAMKKYCKDQLAANERQKLEFVAERKKRQREQEKANTQLELVDKAYERDLKQVKDEQTRNTIRREWEKQHQNMVKGIQDFKTKIQELSKLLEKQAAAREFIESNEQWCMELEKLLANVRDKARLQLTLTYAVEDQQVEVLRTKNGPAASEGDRE